MMFLLSPFSVPFLLPQRRLFLAPPSQLGNPVGTVLLHCPFALSQILATPARYRRICQRIQPHVTVEVPAPPVKTHRSHSLKKGVRRNEELILEKLF